MGYYSDDPVADFAAFDAEQAKLEKDCSVCADCDYPITGEDYFCDGEKTYCLDCWETYHRGRR